LTKLTINWTLKNGDNNDIWKLYQVIDGVKTKPIIFTKATGY